MLQNANIRIWNADNHKVFLPKIIPEKNVLLADFYPKSGFISVYKHLYIELL